MEDWSKGLQHRGVFFEGWVEDLDQVLESHRKATVTSYGTRRSSKAAACSNKENDEPQNDSKMKTSPKIYWSMGQMNRDDTPFSIVETKTLDCQFGPRYYKEAPPKSSRVKVQGSRKIGCHAHIVIRECVLYPEYKIDHDEKKFAIRTLKKRLMKELKEQLERDASSVQTTTAYFVTLPTEDAHHGHPTGEGVAGFSQRMNEKVATKVSEIVADGITDIPQVRSLLRHYVMHDLCKDNPPNPNDRAYFPLDNDLRNHIYMAKRAIQLSCLDQENAMLKIEQWRKTEPDSTHFFRPFIEVNTEECPRETAPPPENTKNGGENSNTVHEKGSYKQQLLWVHQTNWQKQLLVRYGNVISLIDATYKTTKYELALFFICVRTNVGYSVVAEFIVQSESADNIEEALQKLKSWNPDWNPRFFMSDYSEAELAAVQAVFPSTKVYLCDFHREQAWVRWCRDHKHGLTQAEADTLLEQLRSCAWAPPADGDNPGELYKLAVNDLKACQVWKNHHSVRQWLSNMWLSIPERWARAFRDNDYHAAVDTNNGTEAQNKLFKYSFLPRTKRQTTLSSTITLLVENYLPCCKQKYLVKNYQQSSQYRSYKSFIPSYLHDRPRSVVLHCLDRKSNSTKFSAESIHDVDSEKGIFEVEKASGHRYEVNFGKDTTEEMPSCTCKDWLRHQLPCKHFFAVFQHRKEWQWEQLPSKYLQSAYLSMDVDSIRCHFQQTSESTVCNDSTHDCMHTTKDVVGDLALRKQSVSINSAAERVRITLKEIGTLTYACPNADDLILLDEQLKAIKSAFQEKLPTLEGLVIRPAVVDRARQTKKKYAHIKARMRLRQCSALKQSNRRRHKGSSSYRNRVGIRADRLRKEAAKKAETALSSPPTEKEPAASIVGVPKPVKPTAGKKRSRCGECEGCLVEEDCGQCPYCADKPKFGGPGRKKQCCAKRKCSLLSTTKSGVTEYHKISPRNFAQGLQNGYFKAPPGTDLPAIPVPVLQQMENSNTWPKDLVL